MPIVAVFALVGAVAASEHVVWADALAVNARAPTAVAADVRRSFRNGMAPHRTAAPVATPMPAPHGGEPG